MMGASRIWLGFPKESLTATLPGKYLGRADAAGQQQHAFDAEERAVVQSRGGLDAIESSSLAASSAALLQQRRRALEAIQIGGRRRFGRRFDIT